MGYRLQRAAHQRDAEPGADDAFQLDRYHKRLVTYCHRRHRLFAANDNGAGSVDVFDSRFHAVNLGPNAFKDPAAGSLVPFGVQDINGNVYVAYAPSGLLNQRNAGLGRVSRTRRLSTTVRNCTRDEGGPFEAGSQVQVSSHRELLSSRAMVVSVAETSGPDPGRQG